MLPAVGVTLKPQLQVILSFEGAGQLMCGKVETPGKGFWKRPQLLAPGWLGKPVQHVGAMRLPSSFLGHFCGQRFKLLGSSLGQDAGHPD